ncbi:MAG: PAS domain S-box protein [Oscillatoria sp. PMC 1068.18]|nr:PAS domain S-box protein [Oscillatoria sp. PMC 1076.18]MEC4990308.1 PAS domain S-box protein [Oscillatoria sp. PMC 1068.18]
MKEPKNQDLLELFIEQAPVAVAMCDRQMNYLFTSRQWSEDLGIAPEAIRGRSFYELSGQISDRTQDKLNKSIAGSHETWSEFSQNSSELIKWKVNPWRTNTGEIGGLILFKEISNPQQNEQFHLLVAAVKDYAIIMLDPQGKINSWNAGAKAIHGYPESEILEKHFSCFYESEARSKGEPQKNLARAVAEGKLETEGWRVRQDGSIFWAHIVITALENDQGKLSGFAKITRDITEQKYSQEYLSLLERAINASTNGITISDATKENNPLIYVNPYFEQLTGYQACEIIGHNASFLQGSDTDPAAIAKINTAIKNGESCHIVIKNYRRDKTAFWNELHISPVRNQEGKLINFIRIQNDISERIEAENNQRELLQREQLLIEMQERIRQDLNLDAVLNTAVAEVRENLQTDRVVIYRLNSDLSGTIAVESVSKDYLSIKDIKIEDQCFQEKYAPIYQRGQSRIINDIYNAELTPCHIELLANLQVKANLIVPIFTTGEENQENSNSNHLWGLLIAHHCQDKRAWQEGEIKLLEQLSLQLGIAIQQANLFDQLQRELNEKKAAEEIIKRSNSLLKAQQEAALDGILVVDENYQISSYNQRFFQMWGIADEVINTDEEKQLFAYLKSKLKNPEQFIEKVEDLYDSPWQCQREEICLEDGRFFDCYSSPVLSPEGDKYGRIWYFRDISDRKRAEIIQNQLINSLQKSEARFRTLVANIPGVVYRCACDENWTMEYISDAIADLTGYPAHDFIDNKVRTFADVIHPADRIKVEQEVNQAIAIQEPFQLEYRLICADNSIRWVYEQGQAIFAENGILSYLDGVIFDVTERKKAEAALRQSEVLRQSEAKTRALLNAIPDLICRIHQDGTYLDVKADKDKNLISTPHQQIGKNLREVLPTELANQHLEYVKKALATNETQVFEYELNIDSKTHNYETRIVVNGENEILAIERDITERKKVERLKNEFVSIVSHELRTPLTSVRGSLSLIIGGIAGELPDQAKSLLDIAYKNSERLILLINDILDIEKIESGKMDFHLKPLDIVPLLKQSLEANRAYGEQFNVNFVLETELEAAKVNVDRDRLLQVLTNLLSNAAKFSPENETVTVKLERYLYTDKQANQLTPEISLLSQTSELTNTSIPNNKSYLRVLITDTGKGIPEEFRPQIFQKFVQADSSSSRRKPGTGLGLSICKAIIERLGGTIDFETETDVGTTFYFDLPEWEETIPLELIRNTTSQNRKILICEDDPDIAMLLSLMLKQEGFVADLAYNAAQAQTLLAENNYLAMTVDLGLPDRSGICLIREIRQQEKTKHLPIIVVSATAQQGRKELSSSSFAVVDWLDKPIDQERLITAIKQAVSMQTDCQPHILHVEDDPDLTLVISAVLQEIALLETAANLQEAKQKLAEKNFDLVILDVSLPDGSGLELLGTLNSNSRKPIPALVFSGREVSMEAAAGVAAALVKSRTSNQQLIETINSLVGYNLESTK